MTQKQDGTDQGQDWFSDDVATFGDRLSAARHAAGLKRAEFAKRLGVKKVTVADWENDISEPRANRLQMMAGLLNVSVGWLLNGEGDGVVPEDNGTGGPDAAIAALLSDIGAIRTRMKADLDRLGRIESALKQRLKDDD
ncbi:helix-turn-helix domain-containing protein [Shimia biformata]|uniref:helix-turn-helix domain-containing protein n=1 Tax=Shimia biformata TaxID=1294299 RepID=UPI00194F8A9A|nr:helix-turn-helix transcriptional regulator [Shimia biformata]